jgi:hypothetical protein
MASFITVQEACRLGLGLRTLSLPILLCAIQALAQDPTVAFPKNYRTVLDNPEVIVLRAHYGPHESVGVHDHSDHPTVYVYLNDSGPVRFVHEPENVILTRPPTHTGAFRVSPGRAERHSLVNLSDKPSDYLRVELKTVKLGTFKQEFRGPAPTPPLEQGTTLAFENSVLRIERILCNPHNSCPLAQETAPSVLVAFSPTDLANGRRWRPIDPASSVAWLPESCTAHIRSAGDAPAHILRILLLAH